MRTRYRSVAVLAAGVVLCASVLTAGQPKSGIRRDVYVAAVDENGGYIRDLTAADVAVREGGKDREILRVEHSTAKLQVAVAVEESLTPDTSIRRAIAGFIDRLVPSGEIALYVIGRRTEKRAHYTSQIMPLVEAINGFPARALYDGDFIEGLQQIAREQRSLEGRRVLVALAMEIPQRSSISADGVLDELRDGRAVLYAATLSTFQEPSGPSSSGGRNLALENQVAGLERERLFTSGTRQSGGLHVSSQRTQGFISALHQVATDLRQQYLVSYVIPEGSHSDGRVTITSTRKGVTLRAPTRLREF